MWRIGGKDYIKIKKDPKRTGNPGMKCSDLEESRDFSSILSTSMAFGRIWETWKSLSKDKVSSRTSFTYPGFQIWMNLEVFILFPVPS